LTLLYLAGCERTTIPSKWRTAWSLCTLAIREPSSMRLFSDCMRTERFQVRNFINGEFAEPNPSLVIPSEVEESLDTSGLSLV
jgi:hypothetical protein